MDDAINNYEGAYVDNIDVVNNSQLPTTAFVIPVESETSYKLPLHFSFNLFGQSYDHVYINPNGTVSFVNDFVTAVPTMNRFMDIGQPTIVASWHPYQPELMQSGGVHYQRTSNGIHIFYDNILSSDTNITSDSFGVAFY